MKEIPLTQGKVALVDDEDFEMLSQFKWHALFGKGKWYAERSVFGGPYIRMHNQIMHEREGWRVDHKNGNGLDNRRENLRYANSRQNNQNARKRLTNYGKPTSSRFKGVSWNNESRKWHAALQRADGVTVVRRVKDENIAALIYDTLAQHYFGEFAYLNFPLAELPRC
jgi:hypothetical protein